MWWSCVCARYDDCCDGHTSSRSKDLNQHSQDTSESDDPPVYSSQSPGRETDLPSVALVRRVTLLLCRFNLVTPPQANFFRRVEAAKSPWLFMHWAEHRKTNSLSRNTDEKLCTVFILWWKSIRKSKQEGIFRLKETHRQNSAVIGFHARQMGNWMSVISKSRQSCVILNFWRSEAIKSPKWIKQCMQPWLSDELLANTHTGCVVQTQKCHWWGGRGELFQDINNSMTGKVASGSCCCCCFFPIFQTKFSSTHSSNSGTINLQHRKV